MMLLLQSSRRFTDENYLANHFKILVSNLGPLPQLTQWQCIGETLSSPNWNFSMNCASNKNFDWNRFSKFASLFSQLICKCLVQLPWSVCHARQTTQPPRRTSVSGALSVLTGFHASCGVENSGERAVGGVDFAHVSLSCRKLSPIKHCPISFICQHSPGPL